MAELRDELQAAQAQRTPFTNQIQQLRLQSEKATRSLAALKKENARLRQDDLELLKLRDEMDQLEAKARAATQKLAHPQASETNKPLDSAPVQWWLSKAYKLRQAVDQTPGGQIPELGLLTENDWLSIAKDAKFDNAADTRESAADVWNVAEGKLAQKIQSALNQYQKANQGQFPTSIADLQPYLAPAVTQAMLNRWGVAPESSVFHNSTSGKQIITQQGPVGSGWAPNEKHFVIGSDRMTVLWDHTAMTSMTRSGHSP